MDDGSQGQKSKEDGLCDPQQVVNNAEDPVSQKSGRRNCCKTCTESAGENYPPVKAHYNFTARRLLLFYFYL